mgnify:CR=1 FL=1
MRKLWLDSIPCRTCRHPKQVHAETYAYCVGNAEPLRPCFCASYVAARSLRTHVVLTVLQTALVVAGAWMVASLFLVL